MPNTYKRNFLSEVLLRLDLLEDIDLGLLEKYTEKIKAVFPLVEQKKSFEGFFDLNFESGEVKQAKQQTSTWFFYSKTKNKKVVINKKFIFIQYEKYKNSQELLSDIKLVIENFIEVFHIKSLQRLGLRYVNEINLEQKNKLDWHLYINENLLGNINFSLENTKVLARSMGQLVFKENGADMVFNFGMYNKDYPNQIIQKVFLLDYDCYSALPISLEDVNITERIQMYHGYIESLFEASIKPGLRTILNK